jgi:4-hydroxy-tetrahydrodipicolinate synthase
MNIKYKGSFVALLTPFVNGQVDEVAFQKFVEWQIIQGTSGLVPCGTTGESPTLSHNEHERLIDLTVEVSNGRVPVMAGTGSNSTEEAINLTEYAKKSRSRFCANSNALL